MSTSPQAGAPHGPGAPVARRRIGAALPAAALLLAAAAFAALLGGAQAVAFTGQATWYPSVFQGSCGFFSDIPEYVAAWPDVQAEYSTICGRCFAVTCRPTRVRNADGPWPRIDLPRLTQCKSGVAVVVQITDTCPCQGNEQWCCSRDPEAAHLDLGDRAFAEIVEGGDIGIGIIGIDFREVSCEYIGVRTASEVPSLHGGIKSSFELPVADPQPPAAPLQPPAAAEQAPAAPFFPPPQPAAAPEQPAPAAPLSAAGGVDALLADFAAASASAGVAAPPAAAAAGAVGSLAQYAQCGGAGGACGSRCADEPFAGSACGAGLECVRQNRFYWQCLGKGGARDPSWATAAPQRRADGNCKAWPGLHEQCGGGGGVCAQGQQCVDAQWEGACCLEGKCVRQNQYYYECA